MKAQSLRRTLWLAATLLGAGLAVVVGWFVLKVRPASAEPTKQVARWLDDRTKQYHAEPISRQVFYPVDDQEIKAILRPDLPKMDGKKVGVFVGQVPPEPQPETAVAAVPTGPKGLSEVGRPEMVIYSPPRTSFLWEDSKKDPKDPKRREAYAVGEIVPKGGKFRVVDVIPVADESGAKKYRFVYEFEESPGKTKRDEAVFDLSPKDVPKGGIRALAKPTTSVPGAATGGPPGAAPPTETGPVAASVGRGTAPASAPRVVKDKTGANSVSIGIDDWASYEYFTKNRPEALLEQIKTDVATDEAGRPRGVKVTGGVDPGSIGAEFDIRAGDILVSVHGKPVHSRNDVMQVVKTIPKDTPSVRVVIERNGRQIVYDIDPRDPDTRRGAGRLKFKPPEPPPK